MTQPTHGRSHPLANTVVACILLLCSAPLFGSAPGDLPGAPSEAAPGALSEGVWQGAVLIEPGMVEADFTVELARDATGAWTGVYHQPSIGVRFQPLERVELDGGRLRMVYVRSFPQHHVEVPYVFVGTVAADGRSIEGTLTEGEEQPVRFVLHRIGPPGTAYGEPAEQEVTVVSPGFREIRERFNRDRGTVRVVTVLSPTCGTCLGAASAIRRHLLDAVDSPSLRVYFVWGPMLKHESLSDARTATTYVADPRVSDFWISGGDLPASLARVAHAEDGPAWRAVMVYGPEANWSEEPPAPRSFRRIAPGLPEGYAFDGDVLADEVRSLLEEAGEPGPAGR